MFEFLIQSKTEYHISFAGWCNKRSSGTIICALFIYISIREEFLSQMLLLIKFSPFLRFSYKAKLWEKQLTLRGILKNPIMIHDTVIAILQ